MKFSKEQHEGKDVHFNLILFCSLTVVFGMEPWDLFRHWGKTWLFLDYFSKRYFVVGVLGIQPKAVGVRQVLHSTARAHLEQDLAPWESSECIGKSSDQYLTYIKGNGFRVAGRLRVRHIWGRTQELGFSLSHALLVFPFPPLLFSLLRQDLWLAWNSESLPAAKYWD